MWQWEGGSDGGRFKKNKREKFLSHANFARRKKEDSESDRLDLIIYGPAQDWK